MEATLTKRWETRDQMIGSKSGDQKELRILNRTLRWCKDGLVFAANLRHDREVVDELGLSQAKRVSSPATEVSVTRCKDDDSKSLDEEEKRLYQRIIAKLNYLAHDRLHLKYCNFLSDTCCLVVQYWRHEDDEVSWTILEEDADGLTRLPYSRSAIRRTLLLQQCGLDFKQDFSRSTSGDVVTLGDGVLNCWTKK